MIEDDPLDLGLPHKLRGMLDALRHLEDAVTGALSIEGLVLRYGNFYGPGTSMAPGGEHFEMVRKRKFPVVGSGAGVWSFVHIEDAAEATVAAVERGNRGIYNIVDDEPAAVAEWLPVLASALGAKPPPRVPRWLGRLLAGEAAAVMMTDVRGASNAKAKRELGWHPRHRTWREGFVEVAAQRGPLTTGRTA
jgi:nucleoside-diphosphate-sugar epimerase